MPRKIYDTLNQAHFVTFSCYRRRRLLDNDRAKRIVVHFLAAQLKNQNGTCIGFVVMPDHVHALLWFAEARMLSTFMNQWKRRSSIQLKKILQQDMAAYLSKTQLQDPIWQARYYSFNVYSEVKMKEKLTYMHNNPVRAGLTDRSEDWKFGSARWYFLKKSVGVPITAIIR